MSIGQRWFLHKHGFARVDEFGDVLEALGLGLISFCGVELGLFFLLESVIGIGIIVESYPEEL